MSTGIAVSLATAKRELIPGAQPPPSLLENGRVDKEALKTELADLVSAVAGFQSNIRSTVEGELANKDAMPSNALEEVSDLLSDLREEQSDLRSELQEAVDDILDEAGSGRKDLLEEIADVRDDLLEEFGDVYADLRSDLREAISELPGELRNEVSELPAQLKEAQLDLVSELDQRLADLEAQLGGALEPSEASETERDAVLEDIEEAADTAEAFIRREFEEAERYGIDPKLALAIAYASDREVDDDWAPFGNIRTDDLDDLLDDVEDIFEALASEVEQDYEDAWRLGTVPDWAMASAYATDWGDDD